MFQELNILENFFDKDDPYLLNPRNSLEFEVVTMALVFRQAARDSPRGSQ
jgi:hypothetical protein